MEAELKTSFDELSKLSEADIEAKISEYYDIVEAEQERLAEMEIFKESVEVEAEELGLTQEQYLEVLGIKTIEEAFELTDSEIDGLVDAWEERIDESEAESNQIVQDLINVTIANNEGNITSKIRIDESDLDKLRIAWVGLDAEVSSTRDNGLREIKVFSDGSRYEFRMGESDYEGHHATPDIAWEKGENGHCHLSIFDANNRQICNNHIIINKNK